MTVAILRAKLTADTAQFLSALNRASKGLSGVGKGFKLLSIAAAPLKAVTGLVRNLAGGLVRIGQIAAGIILAEVFRKGAEAVQWFMRTALQATEVMQRLGIQIQTLTAREMQKNINMAIDQAVSWRVLGRDGESLTFNVEQLTTALGDNATQILKLNPELKAIIGTERRFVTVTSEVNKKWISTSDVFDQAAGDARHMINELKRIAIISPFTVATVNTMFRLGSAMGFTSKEAKTVTKGMLDVAAGLGLTEDQARRLMLNFSQIRSQSKLTQRDIREMSLTGFQMAEVFEEMNRTLGLNIKTNLDFNDALRTSKFTWEEFVESFASMADREFGESARRMAFTIGGLKSTFQDVFLVTIPSILMPTAELIGEFAERAVGSLLQLVESGDLDRIGVELRDKVDNWISILDIFIAHAQSFGIGLAIVRISSDDMFDKDTSESIENFGMSIFRVANEWQALKDTFAGVGEIANVIKVIDSGGRVELKDHHGDETASIQKRTDIKAEDFVPKGAADIVDKLVTAFFKLSDWWADKGAAITQVANDLATLFQGVFAGALEALEPAVEDLTVAWQLFIDNVDWDTILKILGLIAVVIVGVLVEAFTLLIGVIVAIASVIKNFVQGAVNLKNGLKDIGDAISTLFTEGLSEENISAVWTAVLTTISTFFGDIGILIAGAIDGFVNTIITMAAGIATAFGESIADTQIELEKKWIELKAAFITLIEAGIPEMLRIGVDFIEGLWDGFKEKMGPVLAWLKEKADAIIAIFKSVFDLRSPSRVMHEIGSNVMKGFSLGLDEGFGKGQSGVSGSIAEKGSSLVKALKQSSRSARMGYSDQMDSATAGAATQASRAAARMSAGASQGVAAMLMAQTSSSTSAQLSAEAQTRIAVTTKLDEVINVLLAQGNATTRATAIAEAIQLADFNN